MCIIGRFTLYDQNWIIRSPTLLDNKIVTRKVRLDFDWNLVSEARQKS